MIFADAGDEKSEPAVEAARGVEIVKKGLGETIWAEREIILCGGAVNSRAATNSTSNPRRWSDWT